MKKKTVALLLACVMALGVAVGGTLAWLTDTTQEVKNTFTDSNINITLKETDADEDKDADNNSYKMVPGHTIAKDPKATVVTGSEDCYLFIKVEEAGVSFTPEGDTMPQVYSFEDFLTYEIADGWTKLEDEDGIYYRVFNSKDENCTNAMGKEYSILKDNQVHVQETVTKKMMDDLQTYKVNPTLTFTAYATQYWKSNTVSFSAQEAWQKTAGYVAPDTSSEGTT